MSVVLPQVHIALRNPYSAFDSEYEQTLNAPAALPVYNVLARTVSDDDLDKSQWSVINSEYASDNEDNDEEIYIDTSATNSDPLTVSNDDGFTTISKTMTATTITKAQPDVWAVRVSKKRAVKPVSDVPALDNVIEEDQYESYFDGDDEYMSMTEHELSKSSRAVNLKNIRLAAAYDIALCKAYSYFPPSSKESPLPRARATRVKNEKSVSKSIDLF